MEEKLQRAHHLAGAQQAVLHQQDRLEEQLRKSDERSRGAQARLAAQRSTLGTGRIGGGKPAAAPLFNRAQLGAMDSIQRARYLRCLSAEELIRLQ